MKNKNKYSSSRIDDYIIYCQICGQQAWYSESVRLSSDTGRGGLLVCKRDADATDYGLVPYIIPAERPVPEASINNLADSENITNGQPIRNPVSAYYGTSEEMLGSLFTWDQLDAYTWDQWFAPWGN